MNLIFVITPNEIRIYSGTSQQDISPFYIGGEVIYEYEDDSFAKDLKEIILTILNDKSFEKIAIHIAYTASAEAAAESILREFPPCKLVQAMCYENISDNMDVVKSFFNVSARAEVDIDMKLQIEELSHQLVLCRDEIKALNAENCNLKIAISTLKDNLSSPKFGNYESVNYNQTIQREYDYFNNQARFICYGIFDNSRGESLDIDWNISNGDIIKSNIRKTGKTLEYYTDCILGKYAIKRQSGEIDRYDGITSSSDNLHNGKSLDFHWFLSKNTLEYHHRGFISINTSFELNDYENNINEKVFILKSEKICSGEVFAVITNPLDTEEEVLKWLSGFASKEGE